MDGPLALRPLKYSINVSLDGCVDHREGIADEALHRHHAANLARADALLFGRVTYEMMEAGWRTPAPAGSRPPWMEPFARTINAAKKYVVSSTLREPLPWQNSTLIKGDVAAAVRKLKAGRGKNISVLGSGELVQTLIRNDLVDQFAWVGV